jgi:hypothetical protein
VKGWGSGEGDRLLQPKYTRAMDADVRLVRREAEAGERIEAWVARRMRSKERNYGCLGGVLGVCYVA